MNRRDRVLLVGIGALVVGLAVATAGTGPDLGTGAVGAVGVLAVLVSGWLLLGAGSHRTATVEAPERGTVVPVPGSDLGSALATFVEGSEFVDHTRTRLQDGLVAAAVAVLGRYRGLSPSVARERIEAGEWTEDPVAAGFLTRGSASVGLATRIRALAAGESRFDVGLRRTVDAIAAIASVDADEVAAETSTRGDIEVEDAVETSTRGDIEVEDAVETSTRGDIEAEDAVVSGDGPVTPPVPIDEGDGRPSTAGSGASNGGSHGSAGGSDRSPAVDAEYPTGHWRGVGALAVGGVAVGAVVGAPAAMLAGAVGIGYAAFGRARGAAPVPDLAVERTIDDARPDPGDRVTVTLTVENRGDGTLSDLRVIDGVPRALPVVDGDVRSGTTLRPGQSTTLRYGVRARRGRHEFAPTTAVVRSLTAARERTFEVSVETTVESGGEHTGVTGGDPGDDPAIVCVPDYRATATAPATGGAATPVTGRTETRTGGDGLEFHALREYRRGDPLSRIDWRHLARRREFATIEFRQERSSTTVVVVDARGPAYRAPRPAADHAVDRSVAATGTLVTAMLDGGDRVGVAAIGRSDCWLAPAGGSDQRVRARELLATHRALAPEPPTGTVDAAAAVDRIERRLSPGTAVVVCSPLVDEEAADIVRRLAAAGRTVTVVSPDPTAARDLGHRVERIARTLRISTLREAGVGVIDWGHDEPLHLATERARRRWSA